MGARNISSMRGESGCLNVISLSSNYELFILVQNPYATMTTRSYQRHNCPVAQALSVVGEQWTILLIRDVMSGAQRFDELQTSLSISRNLLARRLKQMVKADLLAKRPIPNSRRYAYCLTPKALELRPAILALAEWGQNGKMSQMLSASRSRKKPLVNWRLEDGRELKSNAITVKRILGETRRE
jgi:DNA-binding HxlR family transcriptional regulator